MDKSQAHTLNIVQEVLRGVVIAAGALAPERTAEMTSTLAAFANRPDADPVASQMLLDLAEGLGMLSKARQKEH